MSNAIAQSGVALSEEETHEASRVFHAAGGGGGGSWASPGWQSKQFGHDSRSRAPRFRGRSGEQSLSTTGQGSKLPVKSSELRVRDVSDRLCKLARRLSGAGALGQAGCPIRGPS